MILAMRTLIGITVKQADENWVRTRVRPYLEALQRSDVDVAVLSPATPRVPMHKLSGIVFAGGEDIHPRHYGCGLAGADRHNINPERDLFELSLADQALHSNLPILGICRGSQLLHVLSGGKLHQHVDLHRIDLNPDYGYVTHQVRLVNPGRLSAILPSEITVNSRHHQVIDHATLHPSMALSAIDEDGSVEAIESTQHGWVVGVQWHPERAEEVPPYHKKIFEAFALASKRFHQQKIHSV